MAEAARVVALARPRKPSQEQERVVMTLQQDQESNLTLVLAVAVVGARSVARTLGKYQRPMCWAAGLVQQA